MQSPRDWYREHIFRNEMSAANRWFSALILCMFLAPFGGSVFSLTIGIMALFALANHVFHGGLIKANKMEWLAGGIVLAYLVIAYTSALLRPNPQAGLREVSSNLSFLSIFPLLPLLRAHAEKYWHKHNWPKALTIAVSTGLCVALITICIEIITLNPSRPQGLAGNSLMLSYSLGFATLAALFFMLEQKSTLRTISALGLCAGFIAMVLAGGRSSLIAITICGFVMVILRARIKGTLLLIGILVVSAVSIVLIKNYIEGTAVSGTVFNRLSEMPTNLTALITESKTASLTYRDLLFAGGLAAFLQEPLTGYGFQNTVNAAMSALPPGLQDNVGFTHLHNGFLTEAVASGILGLVFYTAILLLPVFVTRKSIAAYKVFGFSISLFVILNALTNIGFYHDISIAAFVFWLAICHVGAAAYHPRISSSKA